MSKYLIMFRVRKDGLLLSTINLQNYKYSKVIQRNMKKRGRPVKSEIRQNIVELLAHIQKGYGYEIYKYYREIFPSCTRESIYYHLRKGVVLGEFELKEIKQEKGNFSWGQTVEKRYYCVGKSAQVKTDPRIAKFFDKKLNNE